jgi:hypothetical protein
VVLARSEVGAAPAGAEVARGRVVIEAVWLWVR